MLGAATPALAAAVSRQGGIGFIAAGTKAAQLDKLLQECTQLTKSLITAPHGVLPIGVGFQNWSCTLGFAVEAIKKHRPAIAWLYAPKDNQELESWASEIRNATDKKTQIWIQVGTVREALEVARLARPDVLVLQGHDAGGHGLKQCASIICIVPETRDALQAAGLPSIPLLAAGGIVDGRGLAAALALGASGAVMGTRFLAAEEAGIHPGWKKELLRVDDGGRTTKRSTLCDKLKETRGWPEQYDGRAVVNQGHEDEEAGMSDEENVRLYKEEMKRGHEAWGPYGRMVTYAGTGVGLIKEVKPAAEIVEEVTV
jgi:nitronate monooxygenase